MNVWVVLLKVFGYIWLTAAVLLWVAGMTGAWLQGGFSAVQALLSPFNVANYIVTVIVFAPGAAALMWAEKLKTKRQRS